jgi:hypothetical protein
MAVTTTVLNILDGAYAKSNKNQPATIATEATELTQLVLRILRGVYNFAAEVNPIHFSETAAVVGVGGQWERPESAEAIFRIETAAFAEVVVVPFDDRLCEEPLPSLYEFGGFFTADAAQTAAPGDTDTLTFWYSKRPDDPTPLDETGVLDPDWQEDYNELLILEVAIYLALKDGREGEVELLKVDRNVWAVRFASYLQHATSNLRRRYGHKKRVNVDTLLPMLTGGA